MNQKHASFAVALVLGLILSAQSVISAETPAAAPKPKYGPAGKPIATPLALSHEYLRSPQHPAPDYWALSGFYVPQIDDRSCSAASVAMILNAARVPLPKTADDKVITQSALLEKITAEKWKERLSAKGLNGEFGTTLEVFAKVTEASFKQFGFPQVKVKVVHVKDDSAGTKKAVIADLVANEKSAKNFIVANFVQKALTDDADAGHISPIAAYDANKQRVLILDSDRDYYEPLWVPVESLIKGMATFDKSANANRGYVMVTVTE